MYSSSMIILLIKEFMKIMKQLLLFQQQKEEEEEEQQQEFQEEVYYDPNTQQQQRKQKSQQQIQQQQQQAVLSSTEKRCCCSFVVDSILSTTSTIDPTFTEIDNTIDNQDLSTNQLLQLQLQSQLQLLTQETQALSLDLPIVVTNDNKMNTDLIVTKSITNKEQQQQRRLLDNKNKTMVLSFLSFSRIICQQQLGCQRSSRHRSISLLVPLRTLLYVVLVLMYCCCCTNTSFCNSNNIFLVHGQSILPINTNKNNSSTISTTTTTTNTNTTIINSNINLSNNLELLLNNNNIFLRQVSANNRLPLFTYAICTRNIALADRNPRDNMISNEEYVTLLNTLSNNKFLSSTNFPTLPTSLQTIYTTLATSSTTQIDVTGSKPGVPVTPEQTISLTNICTTLDNAIQDATTTTVVVTTTIPTLVPVPSTVTTTTIAPAPGLVPTAAAVPVITIDFTVCKKDLLFSDISRDNKISKEEYVRFISRIDTSITITTPFVSLVQQLQDNYNTFVQPPVIDTIDITGSKPNEQPTDIQKSTLQKFCDTTHNIVKSTLPPNNTVVVVSPSNAPISITTDNGIPSTSTGQGTTVTIYNSFLLSTNDTVIISDTFKETSQNNALLQRAYTNFITNILQNYTYYSISGNYGGSPIPGTSITATTTTTTAATTTAAATTAPTTPTQSTNTTPPASIGISTRFLRNINQHTNKKGNRHLSVTGLVPDSSIVYQIRDSTCPTDIANRASTTGSTILCGIAFASFVATVENEPDLTSMQQTITSITQQSIDANGQGPDDTIVNLLQLQVVLLSTNVVAPPCTIERASLPLQPDDDNTGSTNTDTPQSAGGMMPTKASAGSVIGSILGVIVLVGCVGALFHFLRSKGINIIPEKYLQMLKEKGITFDKFPGIGKKSFSTTTKSGTKNKYDVDPNNNDLHNSDNMNYNDDDKESNVRSKMGISSLFSSMALHNTNDNDIEQQLSEQAPAAGGGHTKDDEKNSGNTNGGGTTGKSDNKVFGVFQGKKKNIAKEDVGHFNDGDPLDDFVNYSFDTPVELIGKGGNNNNGISTSTDPFATTNNGWKFDSTNGPGGNSWGKPADWETAATGGGGVTDISLFGGIDEYSEPGSADYDDETTVAPTETVVASSKPGKERPGSTTPAPEKANNVKQFGTLVDNGVWDGAVAVILDTTLNEEDDCSESNNIDDEPVIDNTESTTDDAPIIIENARRRSLELFSKNSINADDNVDNEITTQEKALRLEYRAQVEMLVQKTCPDESDNISTMMKQFFGREVELINTLKIMKERSSSQRALKAVHKSRGFPDRESRTFAASGAEGSAVIAAASMLNSDGNNKNNNGTDDGSRSRSQSGSYSGSYSEENDDDDRSGSGSGSGSYSQSSRRSGSSRSSRRSGSRSSRSYSRSGSERSHSRSGSERSHSHSGSERSRSHSGSYDDDDNGSRSYTENGSRTGSRSGSRSGSHSYDDDETKTSDSGSRTNATNKNNRTNSTGQKTKINNARDGKRSSGRSRSSHNSEEESASRSYYSNDGTESYNSRSHVSGSYNSKSYNSGTGSRSDSRSDSRSGSRSQQSNNSNSHSDSQSYDDLK